jgi:hypothetical protein
MGLIREPLDVDFFVVDRPFTTEELKKLREIIARNKRLAARRAQRARIKPRAKAKSK